MASCAAPLHRASGETNGAGRSTEAPWIGGSEATLDILGGESGAPSVAGPLPPVGPEPRPVASVSLDGVVNPLETRGGGDASATDPPPGSAPAPAPTLAAATLAAATPGDPGPVAPVATSLPPITPAGTFRISPPSSPHEHPAPLSPRHALGPHAVGAPPPAPARVGRDRQRYGHGGERLVAGCVPCRRAAGRGRWEVLLVRRRGGSGLSLPKGGWEVDESAEEAAARETVEEAGARGDLVIPPLGDYRFSSKKSRPVRDVGGQDPGRGGGAAEPREALGRGEADAGLDAAEADGPRGAGGAPVGDVGRAAALARSASRASSSATWDSTPGGSSCATLPEVPCTPPDEPLASLARRGTSPPKAKPECIATVFVLRVREVLSDWPEAALRDRQWVPAQQASERVSALWQREALRDWLAWEEASAADSAPPADSTVADPAPPTEAASWATAPGKAAP